VFAAFVVSTGCFTYTNARPGVSYDSRPVQVTLTDSGSVVLASQIGPSMVSVNGILVADSAQMLVVSVQSTERRDGTVLDWKGERVTIPQVLVASLGARQFSASRTTLVTVLGLAAIVAVTEAFGGLGSGPGLGHSGRGPPGPQ